MIKGVKFLSRLLNASCSDVITVPFFFLASNPNRPRPLSGLDSPARWQPVTQSIRSRRCHGKIGDCKQSRNVSEPLLKRDTFTLILESDHLPFNQHIILTLFRVRRLREVALCMYVFSNYFQEEKKSVWERVRFRNRKVLVYFEGNTPPVTPYDVDNVHVCMNSEATLHNC